MNLLRANEGEYKKGFTLIEIFLVFGITAILLVTVMVVYIKVSENNKINRLKEEVVLVRETVRDLIKSVPTYSGFSESILVNGNMLPQRMLKKKGVKPEIFNVYKGNVYLEPSSAIGETDGVIQMTFKNVPQTACNRVVRDLGKNYYLVQVYGMHGDGGDVKPRDANIIDLPLLEQACNSKSNTVIFYFT